MRRTRTGWLCIVGDRALAVVDTGTDDPLVARVWQLLQGPLDPGALLEAFGTGKGPDFVLAAWEAESLAVVSRGSAVIELSTEEGSQSVTPSRFTGWSEREVEHPIALTIAVGADAGGELLPIERGIVRSSLLTWTPPDLTTTGAIDVPSPQAAEPEVTRQPAADPSLELNPCHRLSADQ